MISLSKFKDALKIIEEGLLKPMSDVEVKQIEDQKLKEKLDEILSRSTKNSDGSIDVDGNVNLSGLRLRKLPLKFNKVNGNFNCSYNKLTSLEGSPKEVGRGFDCSYNKLVSLKWAPKKAGEYFYCTDNIIEFNEEQVREACNVKGLIVV